ncbi:hypothetical protein OAO87_02925 [bacterium]|nr:hypothetical protein [bacterium]
MHPVADPGSSTPGGITLHGVQQAAAWAVSCEWLSAAAAAAMAAATAEVSADGAESSFLLRCLPPRQLRAQLLWGESGRGLGRLLAAPVHAPIDTALPPSHPESAARAAQPTSSPGPHAKPGTTATRCPTCTAAP